MIKVSVIVPIYNTPPDLIKRCLSSIENQSYPHVEIVVVDDGSKKQIADFIDLIAQTINHCRVIHTKNQGVSTARNIGVEYSTGDYVMFADGDDVLAPCMIGEAIDNIKDTVADICYGMVKYVQNTEKFIFREREDRPVAKIVENDKQKITLLKHLISLGQKEYTFKDCYLSRGPFARLVKRELAIKTPFDSEMKIGEDALWNLQIAKKANKVAIVYSCWYYYVKYQQSATQKFRTDYEQFILLGEKLNKEMGEDGVYRIALIEKNVDIFFEYINSHYGHPEYLGSKWVANKECRRFINKYKHMIDCDLRAFIYLRSAIKLKWCILQYGVFPVGIINFIKKCRYKINSYTKVGG